MADYLKLIVNKIAHVGKKTAAQSFDTNRAAKEKLMRVSNKNLSPSAMKIRDQFVFCKFTPYL